MIQIIKDLPHLVPGYHALKEKRYWHAFVWFTLSLIFGFLPFWGTLEEKNRNGIIIFGTVCLAIILLFFLNSAKSAEKLKNKIKSGTFYQQSLGAPIPCPDPHQPIGWGILGEVLMLIFMVPITLGYSFPAAWFIKWSLIISLVVFFSIYTFFTLRKQYLYARMACGFFFPWPFLIMGLKFAQPYLPQTIYPCFFSFFLLLYFVSQTSPFFLPEKTSMRIYNKLHSWDKNKIFQFLIGGLVVVGVNKPGPMFSVAGTIGGVVLPFFISLDYQKRGFFKKEPFKKANT